MFQQDWWSKYGKTTKVKKAIEKNLAKQFVQVVNNQWKRSKTEDCVYRPDNYTQLAKDLHLRRDQVYKKRMGDTAFTFAELLSTAVLFDVSPRLFIPESYRTWLVSATSSLTGEPRSLLERFVRYCVLLTRRWNSTPSKQDYRQADWMLDDSILAKLEADDVPDLKHQLDRIAKIIEKTIPPANR